MQSGYLQSGKQMNTAANSPPQGFDSGRLSHAYIAAGSLADALAMAAVCSGRGGASPCMACTHCNKASRNIHPDITVVDRLPDKREILVDQVRWLKKDVVVVPNEADKKVYIINDADIMTIKAQNALLQILEEPPPRVMFILRTDNPAALLPTVRSRCITVHDERTQSIKSIESIGNTADAGKMADEFYSALENGNAQLAAFMFKLEKLDKAALESFLYAARAKSAARLRAPAPGGAALSRRALARVERVLVRAGEMLDFNVGPGHISGLICATLMEADD